MPFILAAVLVGLVAKDFVVPVMALEKRRVLDAWGRLLPMLRADVGGYLVYVLMKFILAIVSAVVFGILNIIVTLHLLLPVGILGGVLFLLGKLIGLTWSPWLTGLTGLMGLVGAAVIIYAVAFVSTPAMVFFQAYTLHFFGSRYPLLRNILAGHTAAVADNSPPR